MAKKFSDWVNQWWTKFNNMKVGEAYEIKNCAKDSDLFIEVCKDYIDNSENGYCYVFSNDYKFFKRFTTPIETITK